MVAVRSAPLFASILNCTVPLPDPLAPDVMTTHGCDAFAVQAHPEPAATVKEPFPPPAGNGWFDGLMVYEHPPDCWTVKARPPAVMVAVRSAPLFASIANCTVPLPDPLAPAVMRTHGSDAAAVHAQPAPALKLIEPVPAPAPKV
jgi:hypothetical protein